MNKIVISTVFAGVLVFAGCSANESGTANDSVPAAGASRPMEFADGRSAFDEGNRLLESGETNRAVEAFQEAVKLDPNLADAYFQLGVAYALIEKREAAAVEAVETPTPDPKQKAPREFKTNSEKAFESAVEAYKKMIATNPEDDAAYFSLGRAYNKLNEDEDAAKSLRQAVKLRPDDTEYQIELGEILIKLAQYREAIGPLKKAIELDPENIRAQELLDDAEAGRKRVDYTMPRTDGKKDARASNANTGNTSVESNSDPQPTPQKSPKPAFPANAVN